MSNSFIYHQTSTLHFNYARSSGRMTHLYRARCLLPMSSPIIEDGAVVVRDGVILSIGRSVDLRREFSSAIDHDLGEVILMPGLINAHCHLDYTMMRGRLTPGSSFTIWIQELNKIKFSLQEKEIISARKEGVKELYSWGCTTVGNIESFPELIPKFYTSPLRLWQFIEEMDIRGEQQGAEGLLTVKNFLIDKPSIFSKFFVTIHKLR